MHNLIQYLPGLIVLGMLLGALHYVTKLQRSGLPPRATGRPRTLYNMSDTPDHGAQVTLWCWRDRPALPPRIGRYSDGAFYGVSDDVSVWSEIGGDWGWVYG